MEVEKKAKRIGAISLQQCKGPPKLIYKPGLKYLTIGDGDLSFSLSIIKWLTYTDPKNQQTYLTATTYDTKQQLKEMYKYTASNIISQLQKLKNVSVFHGIDVNILQTYFEQLMAKQDGYDRIIWNFPHAGFPEQEKGDHKGPGFQWESGFQQRHINVIKNFFLKGTKYLKKDGLAIVTHKTVNPFALWNIPKIGNQNGFYFQQAIDFNIDQYPGYQNRRGAGKCGGKKFPCQDAKTYIFSINWQNQK